MTREMIERIIFRCPFVLALLVLSVSFGAGQEVQPTVSSSVATQAGGAVRDASYPLWPMLREDFSSLEVEGGYAHRQGPQGLWSPFIGQKADGYWLASQGAFRKERWAAFGSAKYNAVKQDSVFGNLLAAPDLFFPYLLADDYRRTERIESYAMQGAASYNYSWLHVGVGGYFTGATHFGRKDPRARGRSGDFGLNATLGVEALGYIVSATGSYRRFFEPLVLSVEREEQMDRIYYLLGFGLYDHHLSQLTRSLGVELLHTAWQGQVDMCGKKQYYPSLRVVYRRGRSTLTTFELPDAFNVTQGELNALLYWDGTFGAWKLGTALSGGYWRRSGVEVYYRIHEVHTKPTIVEMREYARVQKWNGSGFDLSGQLSIERSMPIATVYAHAAGGFTDYRSRYNVRQYHNMYRMVSYSLQCGTRLRPGPVLVDVALLASAKQLVQREQHHPAATYRQAEFFEAWWDYSTQSQWSVAGQASCGMQLANGHQIGIRLRGHLLQRIGAPGKGYFAGGGIWYRFAK